MLAFSPPFDENEVTQASSPPSHEDENMVSCTLFQAFDSYDASFHDLESQEVLEEPLDVVSFSSNKEHDDCIDDFIHVGRRRWDVSFFILMEIPFMRMIMDLESRMQNCFL
jgi:hypothetical protein